MGLLAGCEQGWQAPPFVSPLREAPTFPSCAAGQQRSPVSNRQRGSSTQLHKSWFWCLKQLILLEMYLIYLKKITEQNSAPLHLFEFFKLSFKV